MKRIYVAGHYSTANGILGILDNIRRGQRACVELLLDGYAPFCPWLDYQFQFQIREDLGEALLVSDYYNYSMAWLEVADAMLVISNSPQSVGVNAEINKAIALLIPIFYTKKKLDEWAKGEGK